jgi:hypothetical protein
LVVLNRLTRPSAWIAYVMCGPFLVDRCLRPHP